MSEVIYFETRKKFDLDKINFKTLDKLPTGSVSLAATVQYLDLLEPVKDYLEKNDRKVTLKKGAFYEGHVLGCNANAFDKKSDVLLLLCDGKFHAINNAILVNREIYVFNSQEIDIVDKKEIQDYHQKLEAKKKKFLSSKSIGILVSTKKGQKFNGFEILKERIQKKDKDAYVFISDNLDINEFENYPDVGIFVNTACFGLARDDTRIVNLNDILEFI